MSYLHVFGCAAHTHILKEYHKRYDDEKVCYHFVHIYFIEYDKLNVIFDEILYYQKESDFNRLSLLIESSELQDSVIFDIPEALSAFLISIEFPQYLSESASPTISSAISTDSTFLSTLWHQLWENLDFDC